MTIFLVFLVLQFLDGATTAVFLSRGVSEANPLVAALLRAGSNPAFALLAVKLAACALAWLAWRSRRITLLRRANIFFALCVAWNLTAILTA
jgi:uncharacterized protein DUF5658